MRVIAERPLDRMLILCSNRVSILVLLDEGHRPRKESDALANPGKVFQSLFSWMRVTGKVGERRHRGKTSKSVFQSLFSWMRVTGCPLMTRPLDSSAWKGVSILVLLDEGHRPRPGRAEER